MYKSYLVESIKFFYILLQYLQYRISIARTAIQNWS